VRFPVVSGDGVTAKLVNLLSCSLWFAFALVRYRPEVVIAGQIRRAGPLAHLWSIVTRRPFCCWVYGGETSPDFSRSSWTNAYVRRILRAARFVFTISPYTTRKMLAFGIGDHRVVEVPLGVSEDLRPRAKDPDYVARLGLEGKLVLLTVGRLVERKGVDTMLRTLAKLDEELPPWRYVVVSDGPFRATLESLATRLGIDDKVIFQSNRGYHILLNDQISDIGFGRVDDQFN
jgi:phosphatidylinositol alpha-1,6-mannosyltransferase